MKIDFLVAVEMGDFDTWFTISSLAELCISTNNLYFSLGEQFHRRETGGQQKNTNKIVLFSVILLLFLYITPFH